jgi:hypothetical protein
VLDVATPHTVSVAITDDTGTLVGAASGRAADGMSVRWFDVEVENVDADTLRLTWAGYAKDEIVDLAISTDAGGLRLRIVQSGPLPNTDALGADRVLLLDFDAPVAAEDILATIQESPATQD